jgi:hypothetical protein
MARNPWVLPDGFDADVAKAIRTLMAALKKSGATIPSDAYTQLRLGNIDAFLAYVDWDKIRSGFGDLEAIMVAAAKKGGTSTFTLGGVDAELLFQLIDERAVIYAQERVGQLIVEVTEQMRETVRQTIAAAERGEMTYQGAALELQKTIPLTTRDANAVTKYTEKQFQRFMRQGLSEAKARVKAQNMSAKYAAKLLDSRTRTIARTEIIDASMSGRYIGWEAGVTAGYISNDSVKEWIAEPDACPICSALDGKLIGWNQEWEFPEGVTAGSTNRMPPAHPNCRCSVVILPPDFSDNVFTDASGGEMPEEASEFLKHMQGQHDQSQHGRKGSKSFDTSGYKKLASGGKAYADAMGELRNPDGSPISQQVIDSAELRLGYRSMEAPEGFEDKFKALDKEATEFLKNNPVSVVVPEEAIDSILTEGKIKSIHEIPVDMKGEEYLEHRLVYERAAFGYDQTFPVESRPVSGTVLPEANNTEAFTNFGESYGTVQIVLNNNVKDRTTFTIGDSLDTFQRPTKIGENFPRTVDLATKAQAAANYRTRNNGNIFQERLSSVTDYVEAQVHGGIKLSDISKIIFHSPMIDIPVSRLNQLGIKWEETEL